MYLFFLLLCAFVKAQYVEPYRAPDGVVCSENLDCPEKWPCCSQYGQCGTGPICINGCNPKYSYSFKSCLPVPALLPNIYPIKTLDGTKLTGMEEGAIVTNFMPKILKDYANSQYFQHNSDISLLEKDLNTRGLIHFPYFLITNNSESALMMLNHYDFTYSGYISYDKKYRNLVLGMPKKTTGSLISTTKAFLYGRSAVTMKTSRGAGVVTAIVLISSTQDEIDFEFIGTDLNMVQTNYYYQGELDHSKMQKFPLSTNSFQEFHTYELDWNSKNIKWIVDGNVVRVLHREQTWDPDLHIYKFPQTPMSLQVSIWPAGTPNADPWTVKWAGGLVDWENSPDILERGQFHARLNKISIKPYKNRFWSEIVAKQLKRLTRNSKTPSINFSYDYKHTNFFNETSLTCYQNSENYLADWIYSGLNPGIST